LRILCLALLSLPLFAQESKTTTTASGLGYELLAEGKPGTTPVPGDRVKVHYTGWLTNGTKFDSSRDRGEPIAFVLGVGAVIPGWDEGIALMNVGSKAKLHIPSKLAYGQRGFGNVIPPNSDLLFEVELVDVEKGEPFRPADPEKQKTTESGLKWEPIVEGSGDAPAPDDLVRLRCTVWTAEGKIAFSSASFPAPIVGPAAHVHVSRIPEKFLPEAIGLMKPGGKYRFEVPAELCWGKEQVAPRIEAGATTVWEIELAEVLRFTPLDPKRTRKTESGLEYEVIREGTGATPAANGTVIVHYTGWLEDGTEFDSSVRRGQPSRFGLNQVIRGWTEGIQLMKEGAIYRFRIPASLAYGSERKGTIPPGSTLIFEVELLKSVP